MDDYIKREEVYTVIRFLRKQDHPKKTETTEDIIADSLARTIENTCDFVKKAVGLIPSADVVEVVRCANCKHFRRDLNGMPVCNGNKRATPFCPDPDFFCAYGERRDGDEG